MSKKPLSRSYFFRLVAIDFLAAIKGKNDRELAAWTRRFAEDLLTGASDDPYTSEIIAEAMQYREKQAEHGRRGMRKRWVDRDNDPITSL